MNAIYINYFKPLFNNNNSKHKRMSRREDNINRKLQLEKSQLRSILSDFRKAKHKCMVLCQQLETEFVNKSQFEAIQKQIMIKSDLLDVTGLVALKNKLVKQLSLLFDFESQLNTQKERIAAKKQFQKLIKSSKQIPIKSQKNLTLQQIKSKQTKPIYEKDLNTKQQPNESGEEAYSKTGVFNIPLYHITDGSAENKVERITNFVASLKSKQQSQVGNMKQQTQQAPLEKVKEMLHLDPQFLQMKAELDILKIQKQQLQKKLQALEARSINDFLKDGEIVEQNSQYKIIKIYKQKKPNQQINPATPCSNIQKVVQVPAIKGRTLDLESKDAVLKTDFESPSTRRLKLAYLQQQLEQLRSKRKDAQIIEIQKQFEKQQYNVEAVVSKINSTLENNEQQLRKLRQKRIKIFERQQEVWSELEQL